ncbi:helix-turn-helix transcriptional regulator [Actinomadura sp. WMMB 499]|uniref:helix-turn-helix domain-containing protein n=1 Tax=Actinomadura sp. WMMB 499 TaxID=1219491 RepID=UPI00159DFCCC|nr:helix-turn-helix transcriptional regulator [Actinomadura sp. WMMB 499]
MRADVYTLHVPSTWQSVFYDAGWELISPYVRRLRLAAELRELRERTGVSAQELAKSSGVYRQMISKLENAHVAPGQEDVQRLLDVLGVEGDEWTQLVQITAEAASHGWWESSGIGERQARFANLEAGANVIREYQQNLIPGLLQTEEFISTRLANTELPLPPDAEVAGVLKGRVGRQRMLHRPNGPSYEVILDEVVLRRRSVPAEVFRRQLGHIVDLSARDDRVTVRVLPVDAEIPGYNIPECSFSMYTYPDSGDPKVVALEAVTTDLVLTDPEQIAQFEMVYGGLARAALSAERSREMLTDVAESLSLH